MEITNFSLLGRLGAPAVLANAKRVAYLIEQTGFGCDASLEILEFYDVLP